MTSGIERIMNTELTRRHLARIIGATGAAALLGTSGDIAEAAPTTLQGADRPSLSIGISLVSTSTDPGQGAFYNGVGKRAIWSYFDPLIDRAWLTGDPVGSGVGLEPAIAESWQSIDDVTFELKLRKDVKFHDGSGLTAADVKYSVERFLGDSVDEMLAPYATATRNVYKRVDIVDDYTVRLVTNAPDPALPLRLFNLYVVSKAAVESMGLEAYGQKAIGTGPYKVAEFVPNSKLRLEAFDDYYGGPPPFSEITFTAIPEIATRIAGLQSGELDFVIDVPPDQVSSIESSGAAHVVSSDSLVIHWFFYNAAQPALADKRVRQALDMAIDRNLLAQSLWGGNATVLNSFQVAQWGAMYNPDRPANEFNPDKARQLLQEAGYDGTELTIKLPDHYYTLGNEAGEAVVQMWQDVGVKASVNAVDPASSVDDTASILVNMSSAGMWDDPELVVVPNLNDTGTLRTNGWWTPEDPETLDANLDVVATSTDIPTRFAALQAVLDVFDDEVPNSILYSTYQFIGIRNGIEWTPYQTFYLDFRSRNVKIDG